MDPLLTEIDFQSFQDFKEKFPFDGTSIPICIYRPEPGDPWMVKLHLIMKNKTLDCWIWDVDEKELKRYKTTALRQYRTSIELDGDPKDARLDD